MLTIDAATTTREHDHSDRRSTPWGQAQTSTRFADGIMFYSTAGHGGFHLSPERLADMPDALRKAHDNYCPFAWFEEDCESALVILAFPDEFTADERAHGLIYLERFYPSQFVAYVATAHYATYA